MQILKLENYFNVNLTDVNFNNSIVGGDRIEINYWPELPDKFKNPKIHSVWFDREVIENQWHVNADRLCIIPMFGDALSEFWYKINGDDLLIIDTEQNQVFEPAVYFATSKGNTRYWVREIDILANENIEFHRYTSSGQITKKYTRDELKAVDFRVIGRVIKNVSFRIAKSIANPLQELVSKFEAFALVNKIKKHVINKIIFFINNIIILLLI